MSAKILVIGSTGKTGSELVKLLASSGCSVRAASRNPGAARSRIAADAEAVELDLERPETFAPALDGVDRLFLMARPGDLRPDAVAEPLIDEARRRGVRLIVAMTAMGVETVDSFPLRVMEKRVEASGIPYVHLRPNWFMQNFCASPMLDGILATGALYLPAAEALVSFIDVRDIAAVAAVALTERGHEGRAYVLTGPESLTHHDAMAAISAVSGRTLRYVALSEEAAGQSLAAAGWTEPQIARLAMMFRIVRSGACAPVSDAVPTILGRPAIGFAQFARENARHWR